MDINTNELRYCWCSGNSSVCDIEKEHLQADGIALELWTGTHVKYAKWFHLNWRKSLCIAFLAAYVTDKANWWEYAFEMDISIWAFGRLHFIKKSKKHLFCFWITRGNAQGLLQSLHLGISSGRI